MSKFRRLYDYLSQEGVVRADGANVFQPDILSASDYESIHDRSYLEGLAQNTLAPQIWRRIGLPWSEGLIERTLTAPNGTLMAARLALKYGMACHLAGGTHHAHRDFGSGFCILNDLAYTAQTLLDSGEVSRVLIFDLDVHQGDGTAAILAREPRAFTCSLHCEKNFPFRKSASDLDIGLEKGMEDEAYLELVSATLNELLSRLKPDLVLYDAGIDIWSEDALGFLDISWQGMVKRDEIVFRTLVENGVPVASVIGGGYDANHRRLAHRHAIAIEVAESFSHAL